MTTQTNLSPLLFAELAERFGSAVRGAVTRAGEWRLQVPKKELLAICEALVREHGAVFATLAAADERSNGRNFSLYHVFNLPRQKAYLTLMTDLGPGHEGFPSIAPAIPAAAWAEREAQDLYGLKAVGHPDPRRLVLPDDWPQGVYPMRKDFDPASAAPVEPRPFEHMHVQGETVHEVRVGPIHAGVIEPGHFRFSMDGEHIINLEARLFWTHKGMEKRFEGHSAHEGLVLAERICGACSIDNALAYCQAVEALAGCRVPERAQLIRVVASELERLYNHAGDIAGILTDVAYTTGASHLMHLRERLMQLNEAVAGNRLLFGMIALGGVNRDLTPALAARIGTTLASVHHELESYVKLALQDESVLDRLETTGRLARELAEELGVVGPTARATGIERDARREHPYAAYAQLKFIVPTAESGDVLARLQVKRREFEQSVALVKQAIALLPEGPFQAPLGPLSPDSFALGWSEGPRGENLFLVATGPDGRLDRVKIRTASYMNWPAVPEAALGNIIPDFPLINKSFNLCYACTDR